MLGFTQLLEDALRPFPQGLLLQASYVSLQLTPPYALSVTSPEKNSAVKKRAHMFELGSPSGFSVS